MKPASLVLIKKYNVATPRYTSYPTVPHWSNMPSLVAWRKSIQKAYQNTNVGIALYIHLPFCESLCTYCGCNTRITKNHAVELPYINLLIQEWKMYQKKLGNKSKISEIHLGGGTPTFFSAQNLKFLLESILNESELSENAAMSFEAHPANTTKEHLEILYQIGFRRLSLGIQDFDLTVQKLINRKQSIEQVALVTKQARDIGYSSINYDLIYGLPAQNKNTLNKTIDSVIKLKPDRIAFYAYAHVPWMKPGQRAYSEIDLPDNDEKLELYLLGKEKFMANNYFDIGMDHFSLETDELFQASLNGKLHRNFMGYTTKTSPILIGLGVSSISFSGDCYIQNEKNYTDYEKKILNHEFPISKGHVLSNEEIIVYNHIQNLMCQFKTKWSEKNRILLNTSQLNQLYAFENEGLLHLTNEEIIITDQGKSFVRNICACLDEYMNREEKNEARFSKAI